MSTAGGSWSTIYVDRSNHVGKTNITIQPQNEYFLMWENEVFLTIWALAETEGQKVILANDETNKSLRYGYAKQDTSDPGEEPGWY
ncbi:Ff.00g067070.m01.CDS01 [Fusarium sp. VM40]|nr:Ff.00g067070.m01.CDS01 [Fusarium sp. VM40]